MEVVLFAVILLFAGMAAGALSAFMGYQTDPKNKFNGRKFVNAIFTGTIAGFGLGMAQVVALQAMNIDNVPALVVVIETGTLIASALGVDFIRNRSGDAINAGTNARIAELEARLAAAGAAPTPTGVLTGK